MDNKVIEIILQAKDLASKQIESAFSSINQSTKKAEEGTSGFGKALQDVGKIAAGLGLYKLAEEGMSFAKSMVMAGIETASFYENARIRLTTLLKDAGQANQLLSDIKKVALQTPFDTRVLVDGVSLLVSAGVSAKEAQKQVLLLGNAVLATGGGNAELQRMLVNLQQIKSTGQATSMDIRQFAFAGINIYKLLADSMGTTTEKVKNMKISYDDLIKALEHAASKGGMFEGAMEKASGSYQQSLSNMKEAMDTFMADLIKETGIFELVKEGMRGLTDAINKNKTKIIDIVVNIEEFIDKHKTLFKVIGLTIGIFLAFVTVITILNFAIGVLVGLVGLLLSPFILVGLIIAGLIAVFILFHNQIMAFVNQAITSIVSGFNSFISGVVGFVNGIISFIGGAINSIIGFIVGVFNSIISFITGIINGIIAFVTPIYEVIRGLVALMVGGFLVIFAFIFNILSALFIVVFTIFSSIANFIFGILNWVWLSVIVPIWNAILNVFNTVLNFILNAIIIPIFEGIKFVINTVLNVIKTITETIWNAIMGFYNNVLLKIFNKVNDTFNDIKNTINKAITDAWNYLKNGLENMWNSVTDFVGKIINKFKEMANGITSALRSIKFPHLSISEGSITIMGKEIKYPKLNVDWYEKGGWVRNTGLAMLHAGEFVLSRDMLRGLAPIPSSIGDTFNQKVIVNANISSDVDIYDLSYKLAWLLRNG